MPKPVGLLPVSQSGDNSAMFRTLAISASGLSAQRQRMETVASNIANAETTRGADGRPYRRQVTVLSAGEPQSLTPDGRGRPAAFNGVAPFNVPSGRFPADKARQFEIPLLGTGDDALGTSSGVRIDGVVEDTTPGTMVYDPSHPDSNADGYVEYPNVRITDEIIDMMDARRVYEANATVFQSAKAMLKRALDL